MTLYAWRNVREKKRGSEISAEIEEKEELIK